MEKHTRFAEELAVSAIQPSNTSKLEDRYFSAIHSKYQQQLTTNFRCLPNIRQGSGLVELDRITDSFELFLSNPKRPEIDGLAVHASDYKLITGPGARTRTYCERGLPEGLCDAAVKNRTVLGVSDGRYYMVCIPRNFLLPFSFEKRNVLANALRRK